MQLINLIIPFFMVFRSLAVPGPTHVQQHIADRIPKVTEAAFAHLVNRQLPVPTGRPNCDFGTWGPEDGPKLGGLEICGSILATAATQCLDREADGVAAMTQCLMTKTNADVYTTVRHYPRP